MIGERDSSRGFVRGSGLSSAGIASPACEHCGKPLNWVDPEPSNGYQGGFVCMWWDFMHDCFESNKELGASVLALAVRESFGGFSL